MQILNSDKALSKKEDDKFNRYQFAKRIAQTIHDRKETDCLVISIYGEWGEGKSTVLNFIADELTPYYPDIIIVCFNPWRFSDEESLLRGFYEDLAIQVTKADGTDHKGDLQTGKEKLASTVEKYGKFADFFGVGDALTGLAKRFSTVEIETLKSRFEQILIESKKRLVVVIDDIDRLDRDEAHAVFRLVKLNADFQNTIYILAFDIDMVSKLIASKYGGEPIIGLNFLEKIVQVPLYVPRAHEGDLRKFSIELVLNVLQNLKIHLDENQLQEFSDLFSPYLLIRVKNPRIAIRYANILNFSLPILEGEVNLVDLMVIEGIKLFYPNHYDLVLDSPEYFISRYHGQTWGNHWEEKKKLIKEKLESASKNLSDREQDAIKSLLQKIFPYLIEAFENRYHSEENVSIWSQQKRVCSRDYFDRYFNLAVRKGDLSDKRLEEVIFIIDKEPTGDHFQIFENLAKDSDVGKLVQSLRLRQEKLSWQTTVILSEYLANISPLLSTEMAFLSPFSQAITFIQQAIFRNSNYDHKLYLVSEIIKKSPLPFSLSFFERIADQNFLDIENPESLRTFKRNAFVILRNRLKKDFPDDKLFESTINHDLRLFLKWSELFGKKEVETYLTDLFNGEATLAYNFLLVFTPFWINSNFPHGFMGDFDGEAYKLLERTYDPKLLFKYLKQTLGESAFEGEAVFYERNEINTKENLLKQFNHFHSQLDRASVPN